MIYIQVKISTANRGLPGNIHILFYIHLRFNMIYQYEDSHNINPKILPVTVSLNLFQDVLNISLNTISTNIYKHLAYIVYNVQC